MRRLLLLLGCLLGVIPSCVGASRPLRARRRAEAAVVGAGATAAYALPRARVLAQYPTRGGPDQLDFTATEAALQQATELHLADYMVRYGTPSGTGAFGADSVLSFDLVPTVYSAQRNDTHTLVQLNLQNGRAVCTGQPSSESVSELMLTVFHEAFMTALGVQDLQQRYQEDAGLEGVEILQTLVDGETYRVGIDKDYDDEKGPGGVLGVDNMPAKPGQSSPPERSNNATAILVATLAAFGVFLAVMCSVLALRQSYRAQHAEAKTADSWAKGPQPPACVPTDQSDEGNDDSGGSSGAGQDGQPPSDPLTPGGLLREWSPEPPANRYGKSVRKERNRATFEKPAEFIRIVALDDPSAAPAKARGPVAPNPEIVRIAPTIEEDALPKEGNVLEPHSYKSSAPWKIEASSLEQNLEDLYCLSHATTDPSVASENSHILADTESCTSFTEPLNTISTEQSTVPPDNSQSVNEAESRVELAAFIDNASDTVPSGEARADHELARTSSTHEQQRVTLAKPVETSNGAKERCGNGLMIRVWNYDDESSVEYVEDDIAVLAEDGTEQRSPEVTKSNRKPHGDYDDSMRQHETIHNTSIHHFIDEFPAMDEVGYIIPSQYMLAER